jgi:hypothetical protein
MSREPSSFDPVETLLLLLLEHDLAALPNRREDGDDERCHGQGHEHRGDRSGQEHRRVAAGDDERPPQVLFQQGPEDEARQQWRRLAAALDRM